MPCLLRSRATSAYERIYPAGISALIEKQPSRLAVSIASRTIMIYAYLAAVSNIPVGRSVSELPKNYREFSCSLFPKRCYARSIGGSNSKYDDPVDTGRPSVLIFGGISSKIERQCHSFDNGRLCAIGLSMRRFFKRPPLNPVNGKYSRPTGQLPWLTKRDPILLISRFENSDRAANIGLHRIALQRYSDSVFRKCANGTRGGDKSSIREENSLKGEQEAGGW